MVASMLPTPTREPAPRRSVLDLDEHEVRRTIDVNLLGVLWLWRRLRAVMVQQGHGVLLATASGPAAPADAVVRRLQRDKAGILSLCQTFARRSPR